MRSRQAEDVKSQSEIDARQIALQVEQEYVSRVYARLDAEREGAEAALRAAPVSGGGSVLQARVERAVTTEEAGRRLARLAGVERALCFGRIDHRADGDGGVSETYYIGRIGLRDENREPLLIDWRAEAARPFYTATSSSPGTLARRRHLHLRDRQVVRVDDEVFDLDGLGEEDRRGIVGEAALLAALRRRRTGRMGDVVATIQEEQDQVIRAGLHGVLVVQGGPGTGKTVAALHRAAYLLYTHRDVLERRGVLIVGPNLTFLRYIEQVLPGLGETDVRLATMGELYPGLHATAVEEPHVEVVKGDLRMAGLVAAAVRDRQRVPEGGLEVENDGMTLRVDHETCLTARDRARSLRAPHNVQRRMFVHDLLEALARDRAEQYERIADEPLEEILRSGPVPEWLQELLDEAEDSPLLDETDLRMAKEALWHEPAVRRAIDALWPELTPYQLLTELFADPEALRSAADQAGLGDAEAKALYRPEGSPWTVSDVPLLDEAAELLGEDGVARRAQARAEAAQRRADEQYAREIIEGADFELIDGVRLEHLLDAQALAERHEDAGPQLTTAERAAADRGWVYGHVIVDEAQELSEMAWRAVMRRIPTRSLTVVGDVAQTGSPAGARSWGQMLDRYVPGRWRERRLLVNYRTPAAIMEVGKAVLAAVAPEQRSPEPVRDDGPPPAWVRAGRAELPDVLARLVRDELAALGAGGERDAGRLAVITSALRHEVVRRALPEVAVGTGPEALDSPAVLLTATESKGLEFDAVVVVDPAGIVVEAPRGGHDLYVAVTRATSRLTIVHDGELPAMLSEVAR